MTVVQRGIQFHPLFVEIILRRVSARMNRRLQQLPSTQNPRETGTVCSNKIVTRSPSETAAVKTFLEGFLIPPSDSRDRLFLNGNTYHINIKLIFNHLQHTSPTHKTVFHFVRAILGPFPISPVFPCMSNSDQPSIPRLRYICAIERAADEQCVRPADTEVGCHLVREMPIVQVTGCPREIT